MGKKTDTQSLMKAFWREIRTAKGDKVARRQKVPGGHKSSAWPVESTALGCPPSQITSMRKHLEAKGVKVDYTKDGKAILTSAAHRARVCRALERFDQNAGYSDAAPENVHYDDLRRSEQAERERYEKATRVDMNDPADREAVRYIQSVLDRR